MTAFEQLQARYWRDRHEALRSASVVLFVEGRDDAEWLGAAMSEVSIAWQAHLAIEPVFGRSTLLKVLQRGKLPGCEPLTAELIGLADRDTRTEAELQDERGSMSSSTLFHTPGWCIESSFFALAGAPPAIEPAALRPWVAWGALGWAHQRARDAAQRVAAPMSWAPDDRLHFDFSDEQRLQQSLEAAAPLAGATLGALEPRQLAVATLARIREVGEWSPDRQLLQGVHGKHAFKQLLVPNLNRARTQRSAHQHAASLARKLPEQDWFRELAERTGSHPTPHHRPTDP